MADGKSSKSRTRSKLNKRELLYFYLNDKLYKILFVSRPANLVYCYCFDDGEKYQFVWSDIRRKAKRAFSTREVAKMVNRNEQIVKEYVFTGQIPAPKKAIWPGETKGRYKWSDKDIFRLHDYMITLHRGRPRKDGYVRPAPMPTKAELRAMMNSEEMLYVLNDNGEPVPVWKEVDW